MKNIIKLKNVSKFYYSKGVIASGFSKVNLDFKIGEFVAITGESGSGKSTLLNVISGLDSYEEGELYINGNETSHYTEKDFEDYRRKYIGNIFQNFNLVNSYTVYQNIELVLLLNGYKKKDIKEKVLQLIKTVDLYKFRNSKVSKLSGGQKQRVAIARALAKDTPIIIADEPTGNLDSRSAASIIKLLSEIAKNKLVIIVTHNYDQVEQYVTRKIKMHDGKVLEDKEIKQASEIKEVSTCNYDNITFLNKIRIGLRNTFNIVPKFLLVLAVYLFITIALISEYASFKQDEYNASKDGDNYYYTNLDISRVVLKKKDHNPISDEDITKLEKLNNIKRVFKTDCILDTESYITDNFNFWLHGSFLPISMLEGKLDLGEMPKNDNEIVIAGIKDDYYIGNQAKEIMTKTFYIDNGESKSVEESYGLKISGIKYISSEYFSNTRYIVYVSDAIIDKFKFQVNQKYSKIKVYFMNSYHNSSLYNPEYKIVSSPYVPQGKAIIPDDYKFSCPNSNCINQGLDIIVENLYYKDSINLSVLNHYNKNNLQSLLHINASLYEEINGTIFINNNDYNKLFDKENYQSSIFVKDIKLINDTINELNNLGYETLAIKDVIVTRNLVEGIQILKAIITVILIIVLFFITYFVIRVILKSRNVYFSTIRMLGATKKISRQLLIIELLAVSNLAYFLFITFLQFGRVKLFDIKFINMINNYLTIRDYIVLYIILILMSYLVSQKFANKLFKNSAIKTIKEEV